MLLGLLQAIAINYEFFTKRWRTKLFAMLPGYSRIMAGRIFTYLFFGIALVFFFAPDTHSALLFYTKLWDVNGFVIEGIRTSVFLMTLCLMGLILIYEIIENDFMNFSDKLKILWVSNIIWLRISRWTLYFIAITAIIVLSNKVQPFIYFQF